MFISHPDIVVSGRGPYFELEKVTNLRVRSLTLTIEKWTKQNASVVLNFATFRVR